MSDTPRTDAELAYDYVLADFARKLERELNAAKAELEALRAMHEAERAEAFLPFTPNTTQHNMKTRIVISLTGGVVQGVLCDSPVEILLLDYDVEGADPSTVVSVPQCTKPTEESDHELAFLARVNPEASPDRVQQLFNLKSHE